MGEREIGLVIIARDRASRAIAGIRASGERDLNRLRRAGDRASRAIGGIRRAARAAALGIGVLGVGAAVAAVKFGAAWERAYDLLRRETGATGEDFQRLQSVVRDVTRTVPDDLEQVALAVGDVNTRLGLQGEALEVTTRAALDFARVFEADLSAVVRGGAAALGIFGRGAEELPALLDLVAQQAQATGINAQALLEQMRTFGPVLANAGFSLEETTVLMGGMEVAGVDLTRVMPGLNAATRRLAADGVTDLRGALLTQIDAIRTAESSTDALTLATDLFGAEGAQRMVVAIQQGVIPSLEDVQMAVDASSGTVAGLSAESLTLTERFALVRNRLLVQFEPAFRFVFTAIELFIDTRLLPALDRFEVWWEQNEPRIRAAIQRIQDVAREFTDDFVAGLGVPAPVPTATVGHRAYEQAPADRRVRRDRRRRRAGAGAGGRRGDRHHRRDRVHRSLFRQLAAPPARRARGPRGHHHWVHRVRPDGGADSLRTAAVPLARAAATDGRGRDRGS